MSRIHFSGEISLAGTKLCPGGGRSSSDAMFMSSPFEPLTALGESLGLFLDGLGLAERFGEGFGEAFGDGGGDLILVIEIVFPN